MPFNQRLFYGEYNITQMFWSATPRVDSLEGVDKELLTKAMFLTI